MTPRAPVSAEALIDRLWGSDPPPKAREDLFSYITRIRKKLRAVTDGPVSLANRAGGYVLEIDPEATDLYFFRLWLRQARAMAESGDAGKAVVLLREADALWEGEALGGLPGDWFTRMRLSLAEERRAATLMCIGLELELGHHVDLLAELQRLMAQYPLDETVVSAHMTALYRSGRVTEALEIYRQAHTSLTGQGIEPGPELAGLHQRILRRDPVLAITPVHCRPPGTGQPDTLPPTASEVIGRDSEISLLAGEPATSGTALTWIIEGMPGVGKTALAVHAARAAAARFPDAQLFVSFHAHDPGREPLSAAAALDQLLRGLEVPIGRIPVSLAERAALWRSELGSRRAVIVLDDVPRAEQIQHLLPTRGSCLTLITTRHRRPAVSGASVMNLDVLAPEDAAMLFSRVAGEGHAPDADAIAQAVRLCGFLPLAIHLAASKLKQGDAATLAGLVEALRHARDAAEQGELVDAQISSAFGVSYRALQREQRRMFRLLAVHPCPEITARSAAVLTAVPVTDAAASIGALVDAHLLERRAGGRFGFHDLIRSYAIGRALAEDKEVARRQAASRVLGYYLSAGDQADRMLYPHRRRRPAHIASKASEPGLETSAQAQAWLETEWSSMVHAARYASAHEWKARSVDLAHVLASFLETSGRWAEAIAVHQLALQCARDLGDRGRAAQAELELAHVSQHVGDYDRALMHAEHAAAAYRVAGDKRGEAEALNRVGIIHDFCGRFLDALGYHEEAGSLYREAGDLRGLADALSTAGIAQACLGRPDEAISYCTQALGLYRQVGDRRGEARSLNNLGELHRRRGYHRDAVAHYQESAEIFKEIGGRENEALLHHNMGIVQYYKGRHNEALASYRMALATYRALGELRDQAGALNDIGAVYQSKEHYGEGLAHFQNACKIAEQIGDQYEIVVALRGVGDAYAGLGNDTEATGNYDNARRLAREIGDPYQEAKVIAGIAETALHIRGPEAARIHLRQALAIFERLGVPESEQARIRLQVLRDQAS